MTKFLAIELNEILTAVREGLPVNPERTGRTLTSIRERAGWDIEEMARAAGVDDVDLIEIEDGMRPTVDVLIAYQNVLKNS